MAVRRNERNVNVSASNASTAVLTDIVLATALSHVAMFLLVVTAGKLTLQDSRFSTDDSKRGGPQGIRMPQPSLCRER